MNSDSSSRKSTPWCASVTSPGVGVVPPPTSPDGEIVWCGARKGRRVDEARRRRAGRRSSAMRVTSIASSRRQRRQDRRQPPREHRLAGARAGRAGTGCGRPPRRPRAPGSARRGRGRRRGRAPRRRLGGGRRGSGRAPARGAAQHRDRLAAATRRPATSSSGTSAASGARGARQRPAGRARRGARPRPSRARRGRRGPRRRATARRRRRSLERLGVDLAAGGEQRRWRRGRSKRGAHLAQVGRREVDVIRLSGNTKPEFVIAARTRSRASRTALSASPTIVNAGRPGADVGLDPHPARLDAVERERRGRGRGHQNAPSRWSSRTSAARAVDDHADRVEAQLARSTAAARPRARTRPRPSAATCERLRACRLSHGRLRPARHVLTSQKTSAPPSTATRSSSPSASGSCARRRASRGARSARRRAPRPAGRAVCVLMAGDATGGAVTDQHANVTTSCRLCRTSSRRPGGRGDPTATAERRQRRTRPPARSSAHGTESVVTATRRGRALATRR